MLADCVATMGGESSSGCGKVKRASAASCGEVIGVIFESILSLDCACVALEALARNRSTKLCRWARRASCLRDSASATASRSARVRANVS